MIHRLLHITMFSLALTAAVHGQTPTEVFEEGNRLYKEGRYEEARLAYESIVRNGYVSGGLYYNLGNVYYRMGDVARAILNYERAAKLIPGDEDLQHNLTMANFLLTDRIEPAPRLFIWEYWDGLKQSFSLNDATWLAYSVYSLVLIFATVVVVVTSQRVRRLSLIGLAGCIPVLVLAIALFIGKISDLRGGDMAIVMTEVSYIKNSPDQSSSDAFVLHRGVKVQITDRIDTWIKIRLADGKVGWMSSSVVEVI